MRMLDDSELSSVSGADCSGPPVQGEDVTVTGKRPRRRTPAAGATVIDDPFGIAMFMSSFAEDGGGWTGAFGVSTVEFGRGGGGGDSSDLGDTVIGYPVDHVKGLGISDYQQAWQKVLSEMSAAELNAFSVALTKAAADAKTLKEAGVSDRLAQLAAAVLVRDSIGAGWASYQASDNLRGKSMALFEGFITKAYSSAAALPGGI